MVHVRGPQVAAECNRQADVAAAAIGRGLNNAGVHTTGRKRRQQERKVSRNERERERDHD